MPHPEFYYRSNLARRLLPSNHQTLNGFSFERRFQMSLFDCVGCFPIRAATHRSKTERNTTMEKLNCKKKSFTAKLEIRKMAEANSNPFWNQRPFLTMARKKSAENRHWSYRLTFHYDTSQHKRSLWIYNPWVQLPQCAHAIIVLEKRSFVC